VSVVAAERRLLNPEPVPRRLLGRPELLPRKQDVRQRRESVPVVRVLLAQRLPADRDRP